MPVLPERSIEYTKIYCRLVVILITKTRATGDGVWTIFDYMPKYSSYIPNTTPVSSTQYYHQNRIYSCQYYQKEAKKIQKSIVDLWLY